MFTKELIKDLFKKNAGRNFRIYTNIAQGCGINGVDYLSFLGEERDDREITRHTIKSFEDHYFVVEMYNSNPFYYTDAGKDIYVPYEAVVMVDFITDPASRFYKFSGVNNLD